MSEIHHRVSLRTSLRWLLLISPFPRNESEAFPDCDVKISDVPTSVLSLNSKEKRHHLVTRMNFFVIILCVVIHGRVSKPATLTGLFWCFAWNCFPKYSCSSTIIYLSRHICFVWLSLCILFVQFQIKILYLYKGMSFILKIALIVEW